MSLANTPWPKFRKRNDHNAVADVTANISGLLWSTTIFGPELIAAPPVIGADGTIYLTTEGGWDTGKAFLVALNPDGTLKWKTQIYDAFGNPVAWLECSPAIDSNGTIYITDSVYSLLAFNPDGSLKWRYNHDNLNAGGLFAGVAIDGNAIYCAENGNYDYSGNCQDRILAISFDGNLIWGCNTGQRGPYAANVALSGGYVYVAGQYNLGTGVAYLSKATTDGVLVWSTGITTDWYDLYSPVVADGRVYVIGDNDTLYAVSETDGSVLWSRAECYGWKNAAVVDATGVVYVGGNNTNVKAYYPDGTLKWEYIESGNPGWSMSGVILDASSNILCMSDKTALYILDTSGNLVHKEVFTDYTYEMTPVFGNGVLYIPFYNKLYAYGIKTMPSVQCRAVRFITSALTGNPIISA